jgi:hypothetical protein
MKHFALFVAFVLSLSVQNDADRGRTALATISFMDAALFSRAFEKRLLMRGNENQVTQNGLLATLLFYRLDPAALVRLLPWRRQQQQQRPLPQGERAMSFMEAALFSRADESGPESFTPAAYAFFSGGTTRR